MIKRKPGRPRKPKETHRVSIALSLSPEVRQRLLETESPSTTIERAVEYWRKRFERTLRKGILVN